MKFRIGKADVRLSLGVLPLFVALIVIGESASLAIAVLSLVLHELSHAIAAKNLGFQIRRISIYPFGAILRLDALCAAARGEWIAALAGPIGSLVIASAARLFAHLFLQQSSLMDAFVHTNAAIALLNLLPAYPLDGGRIAKTLLLRFLDERTARIVSMCFTVLIAMLLIALGFYCLYQGFPSWTLFGIAPYLMISSWIEWKQATPSAIAGVLSRRTAQNTGVPILTRTLLIDGSATIGNAMQALSRRQFTVFRIRMNHRSLEADEDRILDAASRFGYDAKLKDVFSD